MTMKYWAGYAAGYHGKDLYTSADWDDMTTEEREAYQRGYKDGKEARDSDTLEVPDDLDEDEFLIQGLEEKHDVSLIHPNSMC